MRPLRELLRLLLRSAVKAIGARAAGAIAGGGVGALIGGVPGAAAGVLVADFVGDISSELVRDFWDHSGPSVTRADLRLELELLAGADDAEWARDVAVLAAEDFGGQPEVAGAAVALVGLVPQSIRASQRRRGDPTGRTLAPGLRLEMAEDLLPLLPARLPRFKPGDRAGDWRLQQLLGLGGFGEVWRAANAHTGNEAALKFCVDPEAARTLRNEATLLGRVQKLDAQGNGVVRLLETALSHGPPYLVYEYVEGGDLASQLRQWEEEGGSSAERAARLVLALSEIVAGAHAAGIVHRDLKPANVLLKPKAEGGFKPLVSDFGIGQVVSGRQGGLGLPGTARPGTQSSAAWRGAYTPVYASPEQKAGAPPDKRDDVHALGVIWYQLVAGGPGMQDVPADWRRRAEGRGLTHVQANLLERCLGALERRPPDAGRLAGELQALIEAEVSDDDRFLTPQIPDRGTAQRVLWDALRFAFRGEPVLAFLGYGVAPKRSRRKPDAALLHPRHGLFVIECRDYRGAQIVRASPGDWQLRDHPVEVEAPLSDTARQARRVEARLTEEAETHGLVRVHHLLALPYVSRREWEAIPGAAGLGPVLTRTDLDSSALRGALASVAADRGSPLSEPQMAAVAAVLRGTLPRAQDRVVVPGTPPDSPVHVLREVEGRLKALDAEQSRVAHAIPDGPQRLRGVAGSGKTVLLARRAAWMHTRHPDWDIAFVFCTRALYQQVETLVAEFCSELGGAPAAPGKVHVMHAWGNAHTPGLYRTLCGLSGRRFLTFKEAKEKVAALPPAVLDHFAGAEGPFGYACQDLEDHGSSAIPEVFDAMIIDEGQDLPAALYRTARLALREPKRLYWAYDQAQGIGSLAVPTAEAVFGLCNGRPVVNVSSRRSRVLNKSYRTPAGLLNAAYALSMGLFREPRALQGVSSAKGWDDLGYEVVSGDFRRTGEPVRVRRKAGPVAHPVDAAPRLLAAAGDLLRVQAFPTDAVSQEAAWVAGAIDQDIRRGLAPEDILVTAVGGPDTDAYLREVAARLEAAGHPAWTVGDSPRDNSFRKPGHVTLATIFRAKGNEAWKVYAGRLHQAVARPDDEEIRKRNECLVALTRARLWCVATGRQAPVLDELRAAVASPDLTFPAFNQATLRRRLDDGES